MKKQSQGIDGAHDQPTQFPARAKMAGSYWLAFGTLTILSNGIALPFAIDRPLVPLAGMLTGVAFVIIGLMTLLGKWRHIEVLGYGSIAAGIGLTVCGLFVGLLGMMTAASNDPSKLKAGMGIVVVSLMGTLISVGLIVVGFLAKGSNRAYCEWRASRDATSIDQPFHEM